MTLQAERTHIVEVALAAAFRYRNDVIGIPQSFSAVKGPFDIGASTGGTAETPEMTEVGDAIEPAD